MNYNGALYSSAYLIYRTQLEFHTGSSPAAGVVPWDKIRPLRLPDPRSPLYKRTKMKTWRKKAWSPGQSWKHTAIPYTHTHHMRMTGSFAQFCLWVLSRRVSPRAADERAGCSSVSLPRAPENVNTLSCNTSEARYTHTHAYTHKQRGEISSNHILQTWDIFICFFYINKQLILTSMEFQGREHSRILG